MSARCYGLTLHRCVADGRSRGKTASDTLTSLVHLPAVDPNFLYLSARDAKELEEKANSAAGVFISARSEALERYIAEAEQQLKQKNSNFASQDQAQEGTNGGTGTSFEARTVQFLKEKKQANDILKAIYTRQAGKEREEGFFEASQKAWTHSLPDCINRLEQELKGPYALGDQIVSCLTLSILHCSSYLVLKVSRRSPYHLMARASSADRWGRCLARCNSFRGENDGRRSPHRRKIEAILGRMDTEGELPESVGTIRSGL